MSTTMEALLHPNLPFFIEQETMTTLRLSPECCVHRGDTEHIYRLPPSTLQTHWKDYRVTLHGHSGHQQRIPYVYIIEHTFDSTAHIHQAREEPSSTEWYPLPLAVHSEVFLHVGIPSTVYSDACVVTILLRGIPLENASKPVCSISP